MAAVKLTKAGLEAFAKSYVDASLQAGTWNTSNNNLYKLLDKVAKQVSPKGLFNDPLTELDGDFLPNGKTIEEYMISLFMPTVYGANGTNPGIADEENATTEGAQDLVPEYPPVEDVSYSYPLGRIKAKTTRPFDYIESGSLSSAETASMVADITWALNMSVTVTRYFLKKQLLGNAIIAADTAGLGAEVAAPADTTTANAFIKQVKKDVEKATSFPGAGRTLNSSYYAGRSPELVLYVKDGVLPELEVEALAGAFHEDKLALPATVKVVDSFGDIATELGDKEPFALLIDPRGIKLHPNYRAVRSRENADGDFINFVHHENNTGYISKYTYIKFYYVNNA